MAQTKYITVAELAEAYDIRVLRDMGSDTSGSSVADENNSILLNAIERASAEVQTYALRGGRYSTTDLADLQTADDWSLKGAVAALAMGFIYRRRGAGIPDAIQRDLDRAREFLKDLAAGVRIFQDDEAITAGQAEIKAIDVHTRGNLNLVGDERYFPRSRDQIY